jgi:hypothetical protein
MRRHCAGTITTTANAINSQNDPPRRRAGIGATTAGVLAVSKDARSVGAGVLVAGAGVTVDGVPAVTSGVGVPTAGAAGSLLLRSGGRVAGGGCNGTALSSGGGDSRGDVCCGANGSLRRRAASFGGLASTGTGVTAVPATVLVVAVGALVVGAGATAVSATVLAVAWAQVAGRARPQFRNCASSGSGCTDGRSRCDGSFRNRADGRS